jgi:hypothetical protein
VSWVLCARSSNSIRPPETTARSGEAAVSPRRPRSAEIRPHPAVSDITTAFAPERQSVEVRLAVSVDYRFACESGRLGPGEIMAPAVVLLSSEAIVSRR